ncbi:hypothetical protein NMG60_11021656 [Bertholletia excelsa]
MAAVIGGIPTCLSLPKLRLHLPSLTFKSYRRLSRLMVLYGQRNPSAYSSSSSSFSSSSFATVEASLGSSKGGAGLLERPTFDQSQFDPSTLVEEGGDIGRITDRRGAGSGDSYRVLLIDDKHHTEQLVMKVLPQAVPSVTPDDASRLFHLSRENGVSVVIVTVKEHAEFYAQMLVRGGLRSTIEPDSSTV